MTRKEAFRRLEEAVVVGNGDEGCRRDPDVARRLADDVLCDLLDDLGYGDVVRAWREVPGDTKE